MRYAMTCVLRDGISQLRSYAASFTLNTRGSAAIMLAVALPVILGLAGLAIEFGTGLAVRSQNQRLADSAAFAAALTHTNTSGSSAEKLAAAQAEAVHLTGLHGVQPSQVSVRMLDENRLELIIRERVTLLLARVISSEESLTVTARAVARVGERTPGFACVLALSTASNSQSMFGSSTVSLAGCTIGSNGAMDIRTNIIGNCASPIAGTVTGCSTWNQAPLFPDPYSITWEQAVELCRAAGRNPLFTNLRTQTTLAAGPHCIDRSFPLSGNGTTNGTSGVTLFFNRNANLSAGGNYRLDLKPAPTLDLTPIGRNTPLQGVLFYGPNADLSLRGGTILEGIGCWGITMRSVSVGGGATVSGRCPLGEADGGGDPRARARLLE